MLELCEIGKCRYYAEIDSVINVQGMLDTLLKNDQFEENEASCQKLVCIRLKLKLNEFQCHLQLFLLFKILYYIRID